MAMSAVVLGSTPKPGRYRPGINSQSQKSQNCHTNEKVNTEKPSADSRTNLSRFEHSSRPSYTLPRLSSKRSFNSIFDRLQNKTSRQGRPKDLKDSNESKAIVSYQGQATDLELEKFSKSRTGGEWKSKKVAIPDSGGDHNEKYKVYRYFVKNPPPTEDLGR